jgi:hypothetical protein
MRKYLLSGLLLIAGSHLSHSQTFEPGYLVLQRGDTLRGEVENAFWEEPAKVVRFRPTATARPVAYAARQLRSVSLASGRLLRRELLIIDFDAETRLSYLQHGISHRPRPDSVLADVLVQGPATLLGIVLNETRHFFVQRPGQDRLELAAHNYLVIKNGTQRIADANNYKAQLLTYFGDCQYVTSLLPTTAFTEKEMQRLVRAYNRECSGAPPAPETPMPAAAARPRAAVRMGVLAGVRYNSMHLKANDAPAGPLDGRNADGRPHALGGLYADIVAGGRRLALHSDLQVSQLGNAQATAVAATPASSYHWRATHVVAHFGLRGFIPVGLRAQLVVGGGYEVNSFWGSTSEFRYAGEPYEFVYPFRGTPLPYLEAGLSRNRWAAMLNGRLYETDYFNTYTYHPWSLSLALSYRLNTDSDDLPKPAH